MTTLTNSLDREMTAVIQNVQQCLVQLTNGRRGTGAGTIWHADGLVLTNAHVVQRHAPKVTLWDGRSFSSRILAMDESLDLAALYVDAHNLPTIEIGHSGRLRAGDWVIAVGHPWGVRGAAAAGAVIGVGVPVEQNGYAGELVQVGIQLRPGHSGGPLVDGYGRLVGINTMIAGPLVGLAVPVDVVKRFLKETLGKASETV